MLTEANLISFVRLEEEIVKSCKKEYNKKELKEKYEKEQVP